MLSSQPGCILAGAFQDFLDRIARFGIQLGLDVIDLLQYRVDAAPAGGWRWYLGLLSRQRVLSCGHSASASKISSGVANKGGS